MGLIFRLIFISALLSVFSTSIFASAYVYMKNQQIEKITFEKDSSDNYDEIILIQPDGTLVPIFEIKQRYECPKSLTIDYSKFKDVEACKSSFLKTEVGDTIFSNVGGAVISLGLTVVTGTGVVKKSFDKEKFNTFVKENNLEKQTNSLMELQNYILTREDLLNQMYDEKQKQLLALLSMKSSVVDKSGQFKNITFDPSQFVNINFNTFPKKHYDYINNVVLVDISADNITEKIIAMKKEIDAKYTKDREEYQRYLDSSFKNYILSYKKSIISTENQVYYDAQATGPVSVNIIPNKKQIIGYTIEIPKEDRKTIFNQQMQKAMQSVSTKKQENDTSGTSNNPQYVDPSIERLQKVAEDRKKAYDQIMRSHFGR